jgi:hypothetical protein
MLLLLPLLLLLLLLPIISLRRSPDDIIDANDSK